MIAFLSVEQLRSVMGNIDDLEFADFCLLSRYTALRSGELLRLQWSDVDNPKGFLRISSERKNKTEARIPINIAKVVKPFVVRKIGFIWP
jgi:integrase